ncbi:2OG-Fe(II) oxygenase family protein, partial [Acinetobacter baumannii]|uniref:2OG-Fe(II) oxygenase family protein n=1 Tax=Acinetobacter baumannii TaxID=470 RepID=UPI00332253C7
MLLGKGIELSSGALREQLQALQGTLQTLPEDEQVALLLGAEEAGLEVKDHDGRWIPINPPPGALVINIGDMLQRLTNHRLPSTTHRVVNPAPERRGFPRYSTPFFLHFNSDYL